MESVVIGSDHRGFHLKEKLKKLLEATFEVHDLGPKELNPEDDYPLIAEKVAFDVVKNKALGVLICGSGHGVCISANKVKGARAILADSEWSARSGRNDDNANILCLHSDNFDIWKMKRVVNTFLNTPFDPKDRYVRRVKEIEEIEKRN